MSRRERPLVPGDEPLTAFCRGLRALRKSAGAPTYRELSRTAHYSVTVLSEAASGRKLPSLAVALAVPDEVDGRAPYPGLAVFQTGDSDRFFGRERLVGQLVTALERRAFVGVFGASGVGKSSLLRAELADPANRTRPTITTSDHNRMLRRPRELATPSAHEAGRRGTRRGRGHPPR